MKIKFLVLLIIMTMILINYLFFVTGGITEFITSYILFVVIMIVYDFYKGTY